MKKAKLGFSLLEALLTLSLVFLILGLANDLFNQYSGVLKFSAAKSSTLSSMQVALQQLADDARQAQTFLQPTTVGSSSNELKFVKVDSSNLTWLNNATVLASGPWVPTLSADTQPHFLEVRYYLSDGSNFPVGTLLRDVGPPSSPPANSWEVAQNVSGMSITGLASWPGDGLNAVQIQISLKESSRVVVLTGSSMRPRL